MEKTKIDATALRVADIIVSTTDHPTSRGIRAAIGTDISHAMIYIGNGAVIEAIDTGVVKRNLWTQSLKEATLAIALRRVGINESQRRAVVEKASQFESLPYDKIGAAGSGMTAKRAQAGVAAGCILSPLLCAGGGIIFSRQVADNASEENRDKMFFCSELVARAFELAGAPIVDGQPTHTNPRAIKVSSKLQYVGHLVGL